MGWCNYIADHQNKRLIALGKVNDKEEVIECVNKWDRVLEKIETNEGCLDKKLNNITVGDFGIIISIISDLQDIIYSGIYWEALIYIWNYLENKEDWDIISEGELEKYRKKNYRSRD